jgi:hypothetical protein
MSKKIENLTAEQEARLPEFVRRWTDIGLCTNPAERPRAEAAIKEMYRCAGLAPPERIVWCGSPLSQGLTRAIILDKREDSVKASVGYSVAASVAESVWASVRESVGASVWASVAESVGDSVWASVWASVAASVRDNVAASVRASVAESVGESVAESVRASVAESVRASVWDSVRASVWDSVADSVYGQHDAGWLAFYSYFSDAVGLRRQTEKLAGLWNLAESAGWALPHKNICWVSERHHILTRDERGRLHSLTGPACAFPDGWAIYAVNGVRVPAHWIEDRENLDPVEVLKSQNVEQRAAGAAIVGWPRMVGKLKRRIIDGDPETDIGALIELTLPGLPEPGRFLQARCPRNGVIVEGVPRISDIDDLPIETVIAAQAWRVGDPQSEYQHPPRRT